MNSEINETVEYILQLGLHQFGGYEKDSNNCRKLAKKKLQVLIEKAVREARIRQIEWLLGTLEHNSYKDTVTLAKMQLDALLTPKKVELQKKGSDK